MVWGLPQLLLFPQHYNTDSISKKEQSLPVNVVKVEEARKEGEMVAKGRWPPLLGQAAIYHSDLQWSCFCIIFTAIMSHFWKNPQCLLVLLPYNPARRSLEHSLNRQNMSLHIWDTKTLKCPGFLLVWTEAVNCSGSASPPEGALWSFFPLSSRLDVPPEFGQNRVSSASHKLTLRAF